MEGSGIGLALTQALVLRMGGTLGVHSRPGEGSVFRVRLPVVPD
ncbi:MAG: ATP-binding protein [Betaproteobacteria bacterium]